MSEADSREALHAVLRERVSDARVCRALLDTPRDLYVAESTRAWAWEDRALPLAEGQTISQPSMVAIVSEALEPRSDDVVLDVGTGSGYQAAVLARLVRRVFGIELRPALAHRARENLSRDPGVRGNVALVVGDAWRGFPGRLRFDGIVVSAAVPEIPPALVEQLAPGGRLLAPVGPPGLQELVRLTRRESGSLSQELLGGCAFVPLVHAR
jgi:protein-L-isoaspartate(D-aspartate) O-methyltransferase